MTSLGQQPWKSPRLSTGFGSDKEPLYPVTFQPETNAPLPGFRLILPSQAGKVIPICSNLFCIFIKDPFI